MIAPDSLIEISIINEDFTNCFDKYQADRNKLESMSLSLCVDLVQEESKFTLDLCKNLKIEE